ncbi:MAG: FliM/FliN family flagellar motor switch protein [Planctomycetota bacterium]
MARDVRTVLSLEVPIVVVLGERSMTVGEVMALKSGSIIELSRPAEEDLFLCVNNRTTGRGTAVKVGENFGLRITSIGDQADRVRALGS